MKIPVIGSFNSGIIRLLLDSVHANEATHCQKIWIVTEPHKFICIVNTRCRGLRPIYEAYFLKLIKR
jgi:hypothetical protein